jgi:ABC-type protease/lipase transport system fused ATPase/permease subunit
MADPTVILHWFDVDIKPIYMFVCFCILMPWSGRMFFWQKSVLLSVEVIVILC